MRLVYVKWERWWFRYSYLRGTWYCHYKDNAGRQLDGWTDSLKLFNRWPVDVHMIWHCCCRNRVQTEIGTPALYLLRSAPHYWWNPSPQEYKGRSIADCQTKVFIGTISCLLYDTAKDQTHDLPLMLRCSTTELYRWSLINGQCSKTLLVRLSTQTLTSYPGKCYSAIALFFTFIGFISSSSLAFRSSSAICWAIFSASKRRFAPASSV